MGPCKSCIYVHINEPKGAHVIGETSTMECRRYPPHPTPMVAPGAAGPQLMGVIAVYPPASHGCGEWHPKVAVATIAETRQ